ncbi:ATP-binding cassette domain-containing protein [Caldimonas thermodepolymerans]|jgi:ABC-type nitrate/sulfonate/bicarbonate transport system, ATPase component|uniref:Aliphatic sulfonate ABC transporter ATP-binding protein n=1 Tax=Caldimonas thermodepolymerans TaxID=215580 RepID=A0A2S5T8B5_9BURK|nr:ATP-binding cassette domain-containing protein [Caldimonas thermodepolymerans]PPE71196.1 aliphatic sulfonate ABC transporter ATP-binding protein [Caldimonas thermodepolymerans]QPC32369.1 ATP-binding cassette domain-containing protein [Caldimonas thermodepolymerans]RDH98750.1 sulfonate transport system ATP-binding protein [Caldimonas thermodepolymerans]TCP06148.1 sulfonate transport system ATP-binding protein [Caldimonas thermodepolymerans]UZG48915.1 ATP-binding cassette domain-containing pr
MHVTNELELPVFLDRTAADPVAAARVPIARSGAARGTEVWAQGLSKSYGGRQVLDRIDLRIAPGEFVAIVGRSGCGKSTLLRLVAGLERGDDGTVRLDGVPQGEAGADGTRIMFQDARLLPWKRVLDNISLGLSGPDARERAREALAQVGLAERAQEWPAVLSGGQRQRVALARALVHRPRLLLLDEPLGALDALTRIEMQQLIERLWREHGFTALLVTHDVAEAVALADRIVLIEEHRVAFDERVALPRPRARGASGFADIEARILERVLRQPAAQEAAPPQPLPQAPLWRFAI